MPTSTPQTDLSQLNRDPDQNYPDGLVNTPSILDNAIRSVSAFLKQAISKGSNIASSATITIPNDGQVFQITGSTAISLITASWEGREIILIATQPVKILGIEAQPSAPIRFVYNNSTWIPSSIQDSVSSQNYWINSDFAITQHTTGGVTVGPGSFGWVADCTFGVTGGGAGSFNVTRINGAEYSIDVGGASRYMMIGQVLPAVMMDSLLRRTLTFGIEDTNAIGRCAIYRYTGTAPNSVPMSSAVANWAAAGSANLSGFLGPDFVLIADSATQAGALKSCSATILSPATQPLVFIFFTRVPQTSLRFWAPRIHIGSQLTQWSAPLFESELLRCWVYYQTHKNPRMVGQSPGAANNISRMGLNLPVKMFKLPTPTFTGSAAVYDGSTIVYLAASNIIGWYVTDLGVEFDANGMTGLAANRPLVAFLQPGVSTAVITLDARIVS